MRPLAPEKGGKDGKQEREKDLEEGDKGRADDMKFITQLRLLLWKNLLLQKTNYFVTFLEVALPIGLVYLSLKLRNLGPTPKYEAAVLYSPHDVFHRSILPKPVFKHVPDTALVKRVMSELADRMVYRGVVNESTEVKVQGFNTETELQKYFDKDKEQIEWIGIVFEGFDTATTLPQNVTFTLRPKYINEEYRSEGWLSLQAMISETLMTMWGRAEDHQV
nr:hypothetical protein BaRGS_007559 [Batillaria attramentaria]